MKDPRGITLRLIVASAALTLFTNVGNATIPASSDASAPEALSRCAPEAQKAEPSCDGSANCESKLAAFGAAVAACAYHRGVPQERVFYIIETAKSYIDYGINHGWTADEVIDHVSGYLYVQYVDCDSVLAALRDLVSCIYDNL